MKQQIHITLDFELATGKVTLNEIVHRLEQLKNPLLLEVLKRSAPSRIVCVSSLAHAGMQGRTATINMEDLSFDNRTYDPVASYCHSSAGIGVFPPPSSTNFHWPSACFFQRV